MVFTGPAGALTAPAAGHSLLAMSKAETSLQARIPSVDRVLRLDAVAALIETYGRPAVTGAVRAVQDDLRAAIGAGATPSTGEDAMARQVAAALEDADRPTLRTVHNLTGTVLHTNLGRAPLPQSAIDAVTAISGGAANLEFDVSTGRRGDRDSHVEELLCRLTGAEAVTVVNNNAAAVLLVLNTLALRKEVPVSRGELIEIGGAFRMPDIMARAGCKLVEVGTTNRTHAKDYTAAIGKRTAMLMKVHTSNYVVEGFTAAVPEAELADLAHAHGVPFAVDLGSGTLVDLARYGLPHEPTPAETLADGADLVTFSGDKLLGGPQAGIIAGRAELVAKLKRNPLKRAMRIDKMTMAALAAVLRLYADPDRLPERLPTLGLLTRTPEDIAAMAQRLVPMVQDRLGGKANVTVEPCESQIGSGSLPTQRLQSAALVIRPTGGKRGRGAAVGRLAAAFRALPVPVVGRVQDGALIFDLRCLTDEPGFAGQLSALAP